MSSLSRRALFAYGLLGLPLAFAALPIYVHVPKLYGDSLGMPLAVVGAVLLGARLLDALIDPLIGVWSDRFAHRRVLIAASVPLMLAGMFGLLNPVAQPGPVWLAVMLALVYGGYSLATINYYAWGAEISPQHHERTRITAAREGCALMGVILAAALPGVLAADLAAGLARLSVVFAAVLLAACAVTLRAAPVAPVARAPHPGLWVMLAGVVRDGRFMRLLAVFAVNGIASAIPATLVLFFISDVLQLSAQSPLFLVVYFVGGAITLPLWVAASRAWGKPQAWCMAMGLAVLVFLWAGTLGPGDAVQFAIICAASGMALGADLALPPSILADILGAGEDTSPRSGAYFGLWNFVTKLNLALAAGVTLPLLQWAGYAPGHTDAAGALVAMYAFAPIVLKLLAAWLLWANRHAFHH